MFEFIENEELRNKAIEEYNKSIQTTVSEAVSKQVEEAVKGLKTKNDELLAEKKTIQEKLKAFADIDDPAKAKEALKFFTESTEAQMIKDGRIEELIQMKTAQFRADVEAKMTELQNQVAEKDNVAHTYKTQFEKKMVEDHLRDAAIKAGVLPGAISDVLMRGNSVFSLSASGEVEARDSQGKLKVTGDGLILTAEKWILGLKETSSHYWPPSKSAGLTGLTGNESQDDIEKKLADLLAKGDMEGYRELRKKTKGGGKV